MIIKVNKLNKNFGKKEVLKNIDFEMKKGEIVSIIGPSGSGKSTLLRTINMLEEVNSGEIIFETNNNKEDITKLKGKKLDEYRSKVGMVFQNFNLFPHKTVLENITLGPIKVKKINKKEAEEKAIELLKMLGLEDKKDVYPNTLSGGQKQRIAIARTLAMNPDIILFDEPTSALDPEMVKEVLDAITKLGKTGITMIIVTHEMNFAKTISDRIVFMADGEIMEEASPKDFFENTKTDRAKEFLSKIL